jgi:hypothetical protein
MTTVIYARQGDLVIEKLSAPIAGELERAPRLTFAGDSSGHPHRLKGPCESRRDGLATLVRVAKRTTLEHGRAGGHKPVTLEPGDYSVRALRERGNSADRQVED